MSLPRSYILLRIGRISQSLFGGHDDPHTIMNMTALFPTDAGESLLDYYLGWLPAVIILIAIEFCLCRALCTLCSPKRQRRNKGSYAKVGNTDDALLPRPKRVPNASRGKAVKERSTCKRLTTDHGERLQKELDQQGSDSGSEVASTVMMLAPLTGESSKGRKKPVALQPTCKHEDDASSGGGSGDGSSENDAPARDRQHARLFHGECEQCGARPRVAGSGVSDASCSQISLPNGLLPMQAGREVSAQPAPQEQQTEGAPVTGYAYDYQTSTFCKVHRSSSDSDAPRTMPTGVMLRTGTSSMDDDWEHGDASGQTTAPRPSRAAVGKVPGPFGTALHERPAGHEDDAVSEASSDGSDRTAPMPQRTDMPQRATKTGNSLSLSLSNDGFERARLRGTQATLDGIRAPGRAPGPERAPMRHEQLERGEDGCTDDTGIEQTRAIRHSQKSVGRNFQLSNDARKKSQNHCAVSQQQQQQQQHSSTVLWRNKNKKQSTLTTKHVALQDSFTRLSPPRQQQPPQPLQPPQPPQHLRPSQPLQQPQPQQREPALPMPAHAHDPLHDQMIGAAVFYRAANGSHMPATILAVHTDDPPIVYYTIRIEESGIERQSAADRLTPRALPPRVNAESSSDQSIALYAYEADGESHVGDELSSVGIAMLEDRARRERSRTYMQNFE